MPTSLASPLMRNELEREFGTPVTVMRRSLSPYSSSFSTENMDIITRNGSTAALTVKNVGWETLIPEAMHVKPRFLYDVQREIMVYKRILDPLAMGAPQYYGSVTDEPSGEYCLITQRVLGEQLRHVIDLAAWDDAVRFLVRLHSLTIKPDLPDMSDVPFLARNAGYYELWMSRAIEFSFQVSVSRGQAVSKMAHRFSSAIPLLLSQPHSLIHGEYFPANIVVAVNEHPVRVYPVDWEMAGIGPSLLDLAGLLYGAWTPEIKQRLTRLYYEAVPVRRRWDDFIRDLRACQLQLALQWLGWAPVWTPPDAEQHDWLSEADQLIELLDV